MQSDAKKLKIAFKVKYKHNFIEEQKNASAFQKVYIMIVGIRFRSNGQLYYFTSDIPLSMGNAVIVDTEQGIGFGHVDLFLEHLPSEMQNMELSPIVRMASAEDCQTAHDNISISQEAFTYCKKCIIERELDMKLVDVEVFFDRSKYIFYFTAPSRIDFRELVKDLVREYRTRIELRQIGVRHETQMIGAVGSCGMVCCCRRYLRKFAPVTIRMAKEQSLFLNPIKISGICGRLLCCLSFEQENYDNFQNQCPKIGKKYQTSAGPLRVLRANMFNNSIVVQGDNNDEVEMPLEEWKAISPKGSDDHNHSSKASKVKKALPPDDGLLVVTLDNLEDDAYAYTEDPYALRGRCPLKTSPKPAKNASSKENMPEDENGSGIFGLAPQKKKNKK